MRHVLYTEPSGPQAGQEMTMYYNPSNTNLTGSPEVYITVSALACPSSISFVDASYQCTQDCAHSQNNEGSNQGLSF